MMNELYDSIHAGRLVLGLPLGSAATMATVEIAGKSGFDAVFVDMEHGPYSLSDVAGLATAATAVAVATVVRVPEVDGPLMARLLDLGVDGVYVPHVSSAQEAADAVACIRTPPLGRRSVSLNVRAADYGTMPRDEYFRQASRVVVAVMIEDADGLDDVESIASTPGLDMVAIGPLDLATDLAPRRNPQVSLETAVHRIAGAVRDSKNARLAFPLMHPAFPLSLTDLIKLGAAYTNCGPTPEARLARDLRDQIDVLRAESGNTGGDA